MIPPDAREEHEAIGPAPPGAEDEILGDHADHHAAFWGWVGEHEPQEPLSYLSHIGVAPERQGEGIGTALMHDGLARADRDGVAGLARDLQGHERRVLRALRFPDGGRRGRPRRRPAHLVHAPRSEAAVSSDVTPGHSLDSTCSSTRNTVLWSFGEGVGDAQGLGRRR